MTTDHAELRAARDRAQLFLNHSSYPGGELRAAIATLIAHADGNIPRWVISEGKPHRADYINDPQNRTAFFYTGGSVADPKGAAEYVEWQNRRSE